MGTQSMPVFNGSNRPFVSNVEIHFGVDNLNPLC